MKLCSSDNHYTTAPQLFDKNVTKIAAQNFLYDRNKTKLNGTGSEIQAGNLITKHYLIIKLIL